MQSRTWTQDEINLIISNLHLNTSAIYNLFTEEYPDRTYDSVQKKVKSLRSVHEPDEATEEDFIPNQQEMSTEDMLNLVDAILPPQLVTDTTPPVTQAPSITPSEVRANTRAFIEELRSMSEGLDFSLQRGGVSSDKPTLVVALTDLHFGKKTDKFNIEVATHRLETMPARIVETGIIPGDVDEVLLLVGGDTLEGEDIYANQNGVLECPVIHQAKAVTSALWNTVLNFKSTFKCKVRVETSPGNHGRMSKTANTDSNWDNVVSMMLGLIAEGVNDPDIIVNVNFDFFKIFDVKGKRGMLYHYGTKHLGTPATQVKFAGWVINDHIDFIVHGHWHRWGVETYLGRPMISNGSLPGPDDLAKSMAVEEPGRQAFFLVKEGQPLYGFSFIEWN